MPIDPLTGGFYAPGELGEPGTWTLTEIDPPRGRSALAVTGWADGPVVVTAGYGGWSRVARPRKGALTEWVGRDTLAVTIDFRMGERAREDEGVELRGRIRTLEQLAGVDIDDPEPPLFSLESTPEAMIPHNAHHASQNKWFIDSLTWDKSQFFINNAGNPIAAGGTMVLAVFAADENLSAAQSNRKARGGKGARRKTYKVKTGDTLQKIAARKDVYGDSKKWKKIATANHIRDPKKLKVGSTLKIP